MKSENSLIRGPSLRSNGVSLVPFEKGKHFKLLFEWRVTPEWLTLWSGDVNLICKEDFEKNFDEHRNKNLLELLMVYKKEEPVGFLFAYGKPERGDHAAVTIYLESTVRGNAVGPTSMGLFLKWLFHAHSLKKIYFYVWEYNKASLDNFKHLQKSYPWLVRQEGYYPKHGKLAGIDQSIYVFAVYRDDFYNFLETPLGKRLFPQI